MNKINYQRELDQILAEITAKGEVPTLLLHSCCAPCSSYVLSYLASYFRITLYYYNPNISPKEEYQKRVYDPERFFEMAKGMEDIPEGGERCFRCYELRQREAAIAAAQGVYDYFTTTLSVSPHKNAQKLNEIGLRLQEEYGVRYLLSDFKKKGGYLESIRLSKEYDLYRQNFCGCVYSRQKMEDRES